MCYQEVHVKTLLTINNDKSLEIPLPKNICEIRQVFSWLQKVVPVLAE